MSFSGSTSSIHSSPGAAAAPHCRPAQICAKKGPHLAHPLLSPLQFAMLAVVSTLTAYQAPLLASRGAVSRASCPEMAISKPMAAMPFLTAAKCQSSGLPGAETGFDPLYFSDFLDIKWLDAGETDAPLVFIFHGLQGSIESPYIGRTLNALKERGLRGLFLHFRSCGGEPNRLARGYHAGETGDIAHVIRTVHEREPATLLGAMGFSLGGNALLKHLGEARGETLISAAVGVSVPYDMLACSGRLDQGFSKIYRDYLLRMIFKAVRQKRALLEEAGVDVDSVVASKTLRELRVTTHSKNSRSTAPAAVMLS